MSDFTFTINQHIGILSTSASGWQKELNLISWNGRPEKYDIREWSPEHDRMGKGVSLTLEEIQELKNVIGNL